MQRPKFKHARLVLLGATGLALMINTRPALGQTEPEEKTEETQADTKVDEANTQTEAAPAEATQPATEEVPETTEAPDDTPPPAKATAAKDAARVEELYVTGSRIKRVDLTTPAPVTVLTRQDIDSTGKQSIGDILQALPAQSNGINTQVNNGGDGSTRIDLRGLGDQRTLVLVNGRRFVSGGTGADASVDLNSIPAEIIERVEILKDGASSIYGSDAISGVVNIITKKAFSGLELNTYMGGTSNGGFVYTLGATAGQRAEKGGFLLSFQWYDASDVLASQRSYTSSDLDFDYYSALHPGQDLDMDGKPDVPDPTATLGSSSVPEGYYRAPRASVGNSRWEKLKAANPGGSNVTITKDPVDGYRAFRPTGNRDATCPDPVTGMQVSCGDFYNYQPENYIVTPSKRISLWGHGDYELSTRASAYFEASYNNRRSEQLLAPEPFFGDQEEITLTHDNVYNPFGVDIPTSRRRLVEFSNRIFDQQVSTYRTVLGVNGSFTDEGFFSSWSWDANFIYGRTDGTSSRQGSLVKHRLAEALGASYFDENGVAQCGTPDNPVAETCTPLNLFGGPGSITDAQVKNLTYNGTATGFSMQRMVNVTTGGSLFELWNRPVGLAIGYAFRREDGGFEPDPLTASGDTTGNKGEATGGGYSENAAFAELDIPLLADLPAVQLLEGSVAVRGFNFSTFGGGATYKLGGRWQVFEHLALRGTYSTAFRAPAIGELFSGSADNFPDIVDPCSTLDRTRSTEQDTNCKADGVPNDLEDDRAQVLSRIGGNPNLDAEKAKTWTAGLVVTPKGNKFIDGLSLTLDVYNIKITNAIEAKGAEVLINNCYNFSSRSDCAAIHRDASGFVQSIDDLNTNVGGNETMGIDLGLLYAIGTDAGTFRFNFDGNLLTKFDDVQASRTVKGVGVYDLEAVYAPIRFNTGIGWGWEGLSAGFSTRYTAGFKECENNDCSQAARDSFAATALDAQDPNSANFDPMFNDTIFHERKISAYAVSDIYAGYSFSSSLGYTSFQAGINNLFNTPPPRIFNVLTPNSDPGAYDFLGRYFYLGLRHSI